MLQNVNESFWTQGRTPLSPCGQGGHLARHTQAAIAVATSPHCSCQDGEGEHMGRTSIEEEERRSSIGQNLVTTVTRNQSKPGKEGPETSNTLADSTCIIEEPRLSLLLC
jgi:hypothetical protein